MTTRTEHLQIPGDTELDRLVARSRLIGADAELVVHGGGNTSSKTRERDHRGRERDVLRIKGSGTDLKSIGADGFPGLFLDELLPLRERAAMSDEEMVDYLAHCMVEPGSRRPSIETLLHAFLPAQHVDHVHADVICALTNNVEPERHVHAALGSDIAVVPYIRPGFALSRQVGELAGARAVVLAKHGLVTWGETHEASYGLTLELVEKAGRYLAERTEAGGRRTGEGLSDEETRALLLALRGRLSRERRVVLTVDRSQRAFADRPDVEAVATAARATPDHILRIGARSAVVRDATEVDAVVDAFEAAYRAYFARHQDRLPDGLGMLNPLPRVILVPGLGAIAAGADAKTARVNAEIAYRSHRVTAMTRDAFGEVDWLSEEDIFDFDYWPLELYKLASAPPPRALAGQVAIVLGAATPLATAIAERLAADGAEVIRAVAGEADAVRAAVETFGGIDILVATEAVPEAVVSELARGLTHQRLGGAVVLVAAQPDVAGLRSSAVFGADVRVNGVRRAAGATPAGVADAAAFLASARATEIDNATLPVG